MALFELKEDLDHDIYLNGQIYGKPDLMHGLDMSVIDNIIRKSEIIFSADDIIDTVGLENYSTVCKVVQIFADIFQDMDRDIDINEDLAIDSFE